MTALPPERPDFDVVARLMDRLDPEVRAAFIRLIEAVGERRGHD